MPRYKKKRHNRLFNPPKKRVKPVKQHKDMQDEIKMSSSKPKKVKKVEKETLKVVQGKKTQRGKRFLNKAFVVSAILLIALVLEAVLPAGILQTLSNVTALAGTGSYPITISGSQTLNTVPVGNYYYVLTDTHIGAYTNSGKVLFNEAHGFDKPVLVASKGRTLVYNQGGRQVNVYDLRKKRITIDTQNDIISASISDSGNFAIATYSDKYASSVSVYNKRNKLIYEWYSAEEIINHVLISTSGRKLAVTTFNTESGIFNSKINVLNFKSATPEHTKSYNGEIVYGINNSNTSSFCVIKSNGIDFLRWSSFKLREYSNDYTISKYRLNGSVHVAVFSRESDKNDNQVVILSKSGRVKHTVKYKGVINDIQVKGSNIYCMNDTETLVLNFKGEILRRCDYGFGGVGIAVTAANTVAVIGDNEIKRVKFEKRV